MSMNVKQRIVYWVLLRYMRSCTAFFYAANLTLDMISGIFVVEIDDEWVGKHFWFLYEPIMWLMKMLKKEKS